MAPQYIPYVSHPRVDITIVVDGNFSKLEPRHSREVLIVRDPWYPDVPDVSVRRHRRRQDPMFDRMYFLSNTEEIHRCRLAYGFNSHFVNLGCFIDAATFAPTGEPKIYDAVMNARFARHSTRDLWTRCLHRARHTSGLVPQLRELARLRRTIGKHREVKRHWLTRRIERLALLDPMYASNAVDDKRAYRSRTNCAWSNDARVDAAEVAQIVTRSHCGLALSELEGVCRASCEYLLCGVPVVTTRSMGGRDVWYDRYNSIVVDATVDAVYDAVCELRRQPRDPARIRADYLARAHVFEHRFVHDVLQPILSQYGADLDPAEVARTIPFRWWL